MENIKTYGDIQYYLYDDENKEKKVKRKDFYNSTDTSSSTEHNKKNTKQTTSSFTGKMIENFGIFCNEFNGPNISINYNKGYQFGRLKGFNSMQLKKIDGDGPSASPKTHNIDIENFEENDKNNIKPKKGSDVEKRQKLRKEKLDKLKDEYRKAKMMDYQTNNDIVGTSFDMKSRAKNTGGRKLGK